MLAQMALTPAVSCAGRSMPLSGKTFLVCLMHLLDGVDVVRSCGLLVSSCLCARLRLLCLGTTVGVMFSVTAAHAALKRVREPSVGYCPSESGPAALSAEKAELSILPAVSDLDSVAAVPATAELDGLPAASTPRRRGRPPLNRGTSGLPSATKKRQARLSSAGSRKTPRIVDASSADTAKEILDTDATSKSDTEKTALADGKQLPDSIAGAASEASGAHHGSSDLDAQHTASKAADSERSENNVADSATEDPPTNSPAAKRKKIISNGKPKSTGSKVTEDSANDPTIANSTGQEASRLSVETGAQSKGDKDESENGGAAKQQSKTKAMKRRLKRNKKNQTGHDLPPSRGFSVARPSSSSSGASLASTKSSKSITGDAMIPLQSEDECPISATRTSTTAAPVLRRSADISEDPASSDKSSQSASPALESATAASEHANSPAAVSRSTSVSREASPSSWHASPSSQQPSSLPSTPLKSLASFEELESGSPSARSSSKPVGLEVATPSASPSSTPVKKKKFSSLGGSCDVFLGADAPRLASNTPPAQSIPAPAAVSTALGIPNKRKKATSDRGETDALNAPAPQAADDGKKKHAEKHHRHTAAEKQHQANESEELRTAFTPRKNPDWPKSLEKTDRPSLLPSVKHVAFAHLKKKKKKFHLSRTN
eukprot:GHVT01038865.1.p1 GENE.GHVT01038865.1~~GHVT01038865.1.p1  ORF type:complete len:662 (+),score=117.79 GHVT01038865.1:1445-3430(+)